MRKNEEHELQASFFARLKLAETKHPFLRFAFAVPNGGNRNVVTASFLKREGVKRGVADVCLPFPRNDKHGAYIEFKAGKNKLTLEQKEFLEFVESVGYYTATVYTIEEAVSVVKEYLGIAI